MNCSGAMMQICEYKNVLFVILLMVFIIWIIFSVIYNREKRGRR